MKIYKANIRFNLPLLIIPIILALILVSEKIAPKKEVTIGLAIFAIVSVIIVLAPLAFSLEVGSNYIKTRFLGFIIWDLKSSDVKSLEYQNMLRGNLGVGKGLIIRANFAGKNKNFTIGEKLYGKNAIEDAKRALENHSS